MPLCPNDMVLFSQMKNYLKTQRIILYQKELSRLFTKIIIFGNYQCICFIISYIVSRLSQSLFVLYLRVFLNVTNLQIIGCYL